MGGGSFQIGLLSFSKGGGILYAIVTLSLKRMILGKFLVTQNQKTMEENEGETETDKEREKKRKRGKEKEKERQTDRQTNRDKLASPFLNLRIKEAKYRKTERQTNIQTDRQTD